RETDHPLVRAYHNARVCKSFSRDHLREHVIPAYMGLIKQLDDNLGRLFAWMDAEGFSENTIIAFTSDHGDYLGDHWMGDKVAMNILEVALRLLAAVLILWKSAMIMWIGLALALMLILGHYLLPLRGDRAA
ncbi:sulfatase-like hydrolase/transferase, partial [bacterium]|nr:sulfatase-like hydrolase/transferase [bacterium]